MEKGCKKLLCILFVSQLLGFAAILLMLVKDLPAGVIPVMLLILAVEAMVITAIHRRNQEQVNAILEQERQRQAELETELEKANAANKTITTFLFNMSHDIRTPMNAILGFSAMAGKYIDNAERALECLGKLSRAGEHLQRLINDVLDIARIESGKAVITLQAYRLSTLVSEAESMFELEMAEKEMDFSVSCDVDNDIILLDRLHIEQIELNLLSNALKYTPKGGKITYSVTQLEEPKNGRALYQMSIKDTGYGMSEEFCARVFDPFEREQTSSTAHIQGTGLGLSIVKNLVGQMGGTISCKSKLGVGTEFIVTIPFQLGEEKDLSEHPEHSLSNTDFTGKRLLLAEDNELNREIAYEILTEYGFLIETAVDGRIALERVSHSAPGYYDLILMDIQMPNLDGYAAAKAIRALSDPALAGIPIIAMTANAFEEDRQNAEAAGMNGHITKPVNLPKLSETLQKVFSGSAQNAPC